MKKLAGFLAVICVLTSFSQAAFAAAQSIVINGNVAEIPAEMGEIIEQDDRTFVPIRFVSESMNKTVKYDENTNAALILDGSECISFRKVLITYSEFLTWVRLL